MSALYSPFITTGPSAATGGFPYPHRTVAEIYGPQLERLPRRYAHIAQRRKG